jgi:hypothetical protein
MNERYTLVVPASGNILRLDWIAKQQPALVWLQDTVEGSIELVVGKQSGIFGYANAEGMLDGLPTNDACLEWLPPNGPHAYHGTIVMMFGFQFDDDADMVDPGTWGSPWQP